MSPTNVRQQWLDEVHKEQESFVSMLSRDRFKDWELSRAPESRAETELHSGLVLRYAHDPSDMAERYFRRALEVLDRVEREDLIRKPRFERIDQPTAHGLCVYLRTVCEALLGQPFHAERLRQSAEGFFASSELDEDWSDVAENDYCRGVRMLLLAGDREEAARRLKTKKRFLDYGAHISVMRRLCAVETPCRDAELLAAFDDVFNPYRVPYPQIKNFADTNNTRFELGLLRDKYFDSSDGTIDFDRVIETISC